MEKINVVVSGLPGKMAGAFAKEAAMAQDIELATAALGLEFGFHKIMLDDGTYHIPDIKIVERDRHDYYLEMCTCEQVIIVDFTWPEAVNTNAEKYCKYKTPFVMGTTGGDVKKLEETVRNSEIPAAAAPNMCKQVVALQWAIEAITSKYPDRLKGYDLKIVESHQKEKKDTSGTAKAMVKYFNQLGIEFDVSQIEKVRDPEKQKMMHVREEYLGGHGFHFYVITPPSKGMTDALMLIGDEVRSVLENPFRNLIEHKADIFFDRKKYEGRIFQSDDGTILFELGHNPDDNSIILSHCISGRKPYALGALDEVRFLNRMVKQGQKGKVYSMIDMLKG